VPENLQMEVIELQANLVLKSQFNNIALTDFYTFYLVEENYKYTPIFKKNHFFSVAHICINSFSRG
jgi:hypothetical protein